MLIAILFTALAGLTFLLTVSLASKLCVDLKAPSLEGVALSAVANFFDALGIGSFAPTTAYLRTRGLVRDDLIPPTMIVGYAFAVVAEAFIYVTTIRVDPVLLSCCVAASALGALFGASLAPQFSTRHIQLAIASGLLIAGALFTLANMGWLPAGGAETSLALGPLAVAVCLSAGFGVLSNAGIGNFGPTLIAFSLLGLDPRAAFPVMMSSAAFMLVAAGVEITRRRQIDPSLVLGLIIGGLPGVLLAAYVVKSLPLKLLRWGVVAVAGYTAVSMLISAFRRDGRNTNDHPRRAAKIDVQRKSISGLAGACLRTMGKPDEVD